MPVRFACPKCKSQFALADNMAGKQVRCQSCKQVLTVPAAKVTAAETDKSDPDAPPTPSTGSSAKLPRQSKTGPSGPSAPPLPPAETPESAQAKSAPKATAAQSKASSSALAKEPDEAKDSELEEGLQDAPGKVARPRRKERLTDDGYENDNKETGRSIRRRRKPREKAGGGWTAGKVLLLLGGTLGCLFFLMLIVLGVWAIVSDPGPAVAEVQPPNPIPRNQRARFVPPQIRQPQFQPPQFQPPRVQPPQVQPPRIVPPRVPPRPNPVVPPVPPEPEPDPLPVILPADPASANIQAPKLKSDTNLVNLPSTISGVTVAGNGRFLLLHLPKLRQLALFDANVARVTRYLSLHDTEFEVAAGMDKFVVFFPGNQILQRFDLFTFKREATRSVDFRNVAQIGMGAASNGPLLVVGHSDSIKARHNAFFYDILTFKSFTFNELSQVNHINKDRSQLRVSPDGKVFAFNSGYFNYIIQYRGNSAQVHQPGLATAMVPGNDDLTIYTSKGICDLQLREKIKMPFLCIPALQGGFYLGVNTSRRLAPRNQAVPVPITMHLPGESTAFANYPNMGLAHTWDLRRRETIPFDHRLLLMPQSKILVVLPESDDRLIVHRFDLQSVLAKSSVNYLYVESTAPRFALAGGSYEYKVLARSKTGGLTYRLDAKPAGMSVNGEGVITWSVPKSALGNPDETVILSVGDKSGQERFHTFAVKVVDKLPEVARVTPPEDPRPNIEPPDSKTPDNKPDTKPDTKPDNSPEKSPDGIVALQPSMSFPSQRNNYLKEVAFTPDGKMLVAGAEGGVRRWDLNTRQELPSLKCQALTLAISPDGNKIAAAGISKTVQFWNARGGNDEGQIPTLSKALYIMDVQFAPDGKTLALVAGFPLRLMNLDGTNPREFNSKMGRAPLDSASFSPDGKTIVAAGRTIYRWDVATGNELDPIEGHDGFVFRVCHSHDGKTLASGSADRSVKLWDPETGKLIVTLNDHQGPISGIAFSQDDEFLVSGAGGVRANPSQDPDVRVWSVRRGKLLARLKGHTRGITDVAITPDGLTVAATATDGTIKLWDITTIVGNAKLTRAGQDSQN